MGEALYGFLLVTKVADATGGIECGSFFLRSGMATRGREVLAGYK